MSENVVSVRNDTFADCISDMDVMLTRTIREMLSRGAMDGKVTATIKISFAEAVDVDGCVVMIPEIEYKVSGNIQAKAEKKGLITSPDDKVIIEWDKEAGIAKLKPMPGAQMEIACLCGYAK